MARLLWAFVLLVIVLLLCGCGKKSPIEATATGDIIDHDFTARLSRTKDPDVFLFEVRNTNPEARKELSGFAVTVAFLVTNSSGKEVHYAPHDLYEYARAVDKVFDFPHIPQARAVRGRVKLLTKYLKPGTYTIQPSVRIFEGGPDAVRGTLYADGGSVAVPAGNKITVKIP